MHGKLRKSKLSFIQKPGILHWERPFIITVGYSTLIFFFAFCRLDDGLYGWLAYFCSVPLVCALDELHPRILFNHI